MNRTELMSKASKAAHDYKLVYGTFPRKIGIHPQQLGLLPPCMYFAILPEIKITSIAELGEIGSISGIEQHQADFMPVAGSDIHMDEVYFHVPGSIDGCISGRFVAKLAKEHNL